MNSNEEKEKSTSSCGGNCAGCQGECAKSIDELTADELKYLYQKEKALNEGLISENEELMKEQEEFRKKLQKSESYLNQLAAMKNDFENYKRRTKQAAAEASDEGTRKVVELLLPLLDSFLRAETSEKDEQTKNALQLLSRQLEKTLSDAGVEEISVKGEIFDPETSNAVMKTDAGTENAGKVVEVIAKGFKYKEKIIRHAQVVVGE